MTNELSNLQQQIQQALQLLQESEVFAPEHQSNLHGALSTTDIFFAEHGSLLERCAQVCAQYQNKKPTIRIIHHLACTGGTLISKCISAMPNIFLLSETHPYTALHLGGGKPKFSPTDISTLCRHAQIPNIELLLKELFLQSILITHKHVANCGGTLILREHTHSDFHVGNRILDRASVIDALSDHFNIKSVLTFRDPIDSYLSLRLNKWMHFTPGTFEEYCARILLMIEAYKEAPIFHYEAFVKSPHETLLDLCKALSIDYDETWQNIFDMARITGDSGRSSSVIATRMRHEFDADIADEIASSESYKKIKNLLY
jgi:hypothetical protein